MKKDVLGIKIDDINIGQALETVEGWLKGKGKHYIVTPNPEIVVASQSDKDLKQILNDADLSIPDGVGLKLSKKVRNTVAGIDFMEKLLMLASDKAYTIGLLGGKQGVAKKAAECLRAGYPGLKISFAESGGEVDQVGIMNNEFNIPELDLLFVAFGPPKQEKWIAKNIKNLPIKVAMTVGGAFDYLSGQVPRAPVFIRKLGFEWLFRLAVQPWRLKRQLALVKYVWLLTKQ